MLISLIDKLLFIVFFMSVLNLFRHSWEIFRRLRGGDWNKKYEIGTTELILLMMSLSYLLSTIFVGVKI
jgi:hypothetical protein